jgi:hypothetical protein
MRKRGSITGGLKDTIAPFWKQATQKILVKL